MSTVNYIPLQDTTNNNVATSTQESDALPEPSQADMCLIRRSSRFVYFLCFIQIAFGMFALFGFGSLVLGIVSVLFPIMGIVGTRKRRPGLLIAHFVYSLIIYIFTLITIILMIVYCDHCSFWGYVAGFILLVLQAIGMRHLRIMIGFARLYPTYRCNWNSRCASKCNTNKACQTQQVSIQVETPQQQVPQQQQQQQQVPQQQYYPAPQVVAIPQPYMAMQNMQPMNMQNMRYPMMTPQGIPMMPMGMQPYIPNYPPVQQDPQQQLYPNVHPVYRQN